MKIWIAALATTLTGSIAQGQTHQDALLSALETQGQDPVEFANQALEQHDLLIFDDGLHLAAEPWDFYRELVNSADFDARHIFIEVIPVNQQPHIDAYLATYPEDQSLLWPALQDAAMTGWRYETYVSLLSSIHSHNENLDADQRIQVHGIDTPSYWREIDTPADYRTITDTTREGRDAYMYAEIINVLDRMSGEEKGIFLTNTRHAYMRLQRADGSGGFWNTAAYFETRHPGQALSIRINAPFLLVERELEDAAQSTGEGLGRVVYSWGRADSGDWDRAFAAYGQRPVAISLSDTEFGAAPYIGNAMLTSAPGQTMSDAYDAVIQLGPISQMHRSANYSPMYTPEFREEVARRYQTAYTPEELQRMLDRNEVADLDALVSAIAAAEDRTPLAQAQGLEPLD